MTNQYRTTTMVVLAILVATLVIFAWIADTAHAESPIPHTQLLVLTQNKQQQTIDVAVVVRTYDMNADAGEVEIYYDPTTVSLSVSVPQDITVIQQPLGDTPGKFYLMYGRLGDVLRDNQKVATVRLTRRTQAGSVSLTTRSNNHTYQGFFVGIAPDVQYVIDAETIAEEDTALLPSTFMVVGGEVVIGDHFAPLGTLVEISCRGNVTSEAKTEGNGLFRANVLGGDTACQDGDSFEFRVSGKPITGFVVQSGSTAWKPFGTAIVTIVSP